MAIGALLQLILSQTYGDRVGPYPHHRASTPRQYSSSDLITTAEVQSNILSLIRWRYATPAPVKKEGKSKENNDTSTEKEEVVYHGPRSALHKKRKLQSLPVPFLFPIIAYIPQPRGPPGYLTIILNKLRRCLLSSYVLFGVTCNFLIYHWVSDPYIHKLRWQPGSDKFEVEILSWYGIYPTRRTIKFADIRPPRADKYKFSEWPNYSKFWIQMSIASFVANGNAYILDYKHIRNKELLAMLTHPLKFK